MKKLFLIFIVLSICTLATDKKPEMLVVKKGSFLMGCEENSSDCPDNEKPLHNVTINYDFEIAKNMITVKEYMEFVNAIKSGYLDFEALVEYGEWGPEPPYPAELRKEILPNENSDQPIVGMTMANVQAYISWFNTKTGKNYRLPSEAELMYVVKSRDPSRCSSSNGTNKPKCEIDIVYDTELLADNYSDTYKDTPRDGKRHINYSDLYVIRGLVGNDVYYGRGSLERHRGFHRVGFRMVRTLNDTEKNLP